METFDETIERLARDGEEMGAVGELLQREGHMEREDVQARMRRLVHEYGCEGKAALGRYSCSDLTLLLSAKQLHLEEVSERLVKGTDSPMVAWRLKNILECQLREVGQEVQKNLGLGR